MDRRAFLRAGAAVAVPALVPGVTAASTGSGTGRAGGVVWSQRDPNPGTQRLFDVVRGPGDGFTVCGYGTSGGGARPLVRVTDRWGRSESQRRGPEWGDRCHELLPLDRGHLLAGVDDDAPMLGRFEDLSGPVWTRTYDGTPEGTIRAATTGDAHAVGWTEPADPPDTAGVAVVGTDTGGNERWSDRAGDGRRLVELLSTGTDPPSLVAVGTRIDGPRGSATVWEPDGAQVRDARLETPGDGPAAAVAAGGAVTLAGTGEDGWWLQRRRPDWGVDWTRTYDAGGTDRGVDDLVVQGDGYGLLAHDAEGAVVLRTDAGGGERWRGRYAPSSGGDGEGATDRGRSMLPVGDDGFVLAGSAAGEEGRDWWVARVGEPGATTPADVPDPTPTPPPTTAPPTGPPPTGSGSPSPTPDAGTRAPELPDDGSGGDATASDGPGFGVLAALAGLSGWLAARRRDD